jgi:hypothetical protein
MQYKRRWWSEEDLQFLRDNYPTMERKELCKKLKRGWEGIKTAGAIHGIRRPRRRAGALHFVNGKPKYRILKNGCWKWIAAINAKGYPLTRGGNTTLAHRQAYIDKHGPIPDSFDVDHLCKYRRCVNTDHLEAVPHAENVRRGSLAKLTKAQAEAIKKIPQTVSDGQIAETYGMSMGAIYFIRTGRSWR